MAQPVVLLIQAKDEASRVIKGVATAAVDAAKLLAAASAAVGAEAVIAVKAASEQRAAQDKLAFALAKSNQLTRENYDALVAQAQALADTTGVTDEQAMALEALALNQGATVAQAKQIAAAALDMKAALGKDAEKSVEDLTKSLKGMKGPLAEIDSAIGNLTTSQLKNGEAINIIAERYKGFAAQEAQSFEGAVNSAADAFGELQEEIGSAVTENQAFVEIAKAVEQATKGITRIVSENKEMFGQLVKDGIHIAIDAFDQFLEAVADSKLAFAFAKESILEYVKTVVDKLSPILKAVFDDETVDGWLSGLDESLDATRKQVTEATKWRNAVNDVRGELAIVGKTIETAVNRPMKDAVDTAQELQNRVGGISVNFDEDLLTKNLKEWSDRQELDIQINAILSDVDVQELTGTVTLDRAPELDTSAIKSDWEQATIEGVSAALSSGTIGGLLGSVGGTIGNMIGEPIIGAVAGLGAVILDGLANFTPGSFQGFIDGLINSLMAALKNVGPAIAIVADNLDEIMVALTMAIPQVIASIIANLPAILGALVTSTIKMFATFFHKSFWENFFDVFKGANNVNKEILSAIGEWFANVGNEIKDGLTAAGEAIGEWLSGVGEMLVDGIGSALSAIGAAIITALDFFLDLEEIKAFYRGTILTAVQSIGKFFVDVGNAIGGFFMENVAEPLGNIGGTVKAGLVDIGRFIRDEIGGAIRDGVRDVGRFVNDKVFDPVKQFIEDFVNLMIDGINFIIRGLNELPFVDIPQISAAEFADGGIVPGPRGAPMPATVHGGEVVVNSEGQANILDAIARGSNADSGQRVTVQIFERRESRGEIRAMVLDAINDLSRARMIRDIRVGVPA